MFCDAPRGLPLSLQKRMPLSWNEIRHRAIKFSNDWKNAASESAEKQTFWNEFFDVFGVARKPVASFEAPVKKAHRPIRSRRQTKTCARKEGRMILRANGASLTQPSPSGWESG
jgi:hypothetical protein